MNNFILVFIGGALGSVARYSASLFLISFFQNKFFLATILVNVIGSLLIGVLYVLASDQIKIISESMRLLLMVGFLGGFTTFSAFSLDFFRLMEAGQIWLAGFYVLLSVVLSLIAVFGGFYLTKLVV